MLTRRSAFKAAAGIAASAGLGGPALAQAKDKVIKVGLNLSFTGADALGAQRIANGAQMAFDEANQKKLVKGYVFQVEMTYRALLLGFRVIEVPITFRDREVGTSKMSRGIVREAAVHVPRLRTLRKRR